jgi:serine/threonine protein kinase
MRSSVASLPRFRALIQNKPDLGQLCGSDNLLRDRYKIIQALGRGGFGVTFLAQDVTLPGHPLCVIKQLCPKVRSKEALRRATERFEREAKILGQLGSHSHLPGLLDYFELQEEFYLVQEYVRGSNLVQEIKRHGPQSETSVKRFLVEILPVISYIHQNQVIHRDIKPPNIIRCQDDGRLVLIDFGAVKEQIAEASAVSQKSPTTQFVGTVGFAPPEQLALRPVYSSDIYATGITCLYLLTGKPPIEFDADPYTGEIRWKQLTDVSHHFGRVLDKMMHPESQARYQSAEQVLNALELEHHLDSLAGCMNTRPRAIAADSDQSLDYLAPISRTAVEIRNWRSRLQARQAKQSWQMMSSSCFS